MEIVNTDKIQLQSLKNFLAELGYSWFSIDKVFYSPFETNKARTTVSLRSAVLAHNGSFNEIHGKVLNQRVCLVTSLMSGGKLLTQQRLSTLYIFSNARRRGITSRLRNIL